MQFVALWGDQLALDVGETLVTGTPHSMQVIAEGVSPPPDSVLLFGTKGAPVSRSGIRIVDLRHDTPLIERIPEECKKVKCHVAISQPLGNRNACKSRAHAIAQLPQKIEHILGLRENESVTEEQPQEYGWHNPAMT